MEINQIVTLTTTVDVTINPILKDVGAMTLKADIYPDGVVNYFMFGIPMEQVPQPLHPAVQSIFDDFVAQVVVKVEELGYGSPTTL